MVPLVLVPLLAVGRPQVQPPHATFIEAESCTDQTFNGAADFPDVVSGGKILRLWKDPDPPAEGYYARFPFRVAEAGTQHVWVSASLPPSTSNFWWRIDDKPWGHITPDTIEGFPTMYGVSNAMAWIELTAVRLPAGPHTLTIRVNERRAMLERAYLLYLDAILITPGKGVPIGLVTPADVPNLKPKPAPPAPVRRAGKPGPPMMLGTSVMEARQNRLVRSLGFTVSQTDSDHLTVNETAPGVWDWTSADTGLAKATSAGLKWQYFPHFHWPPEWYRKGPQFVPTVGLRSGKRLPCMSLWSPDIERWFDAGYAAIADHYGGGPDKVYAFYLGIHGDFGEATYPAGYHPDEARLYGPSGTAVPDYWCGDEHARADFRRFALGKHSSMQALNAAWGTQFAAEADVDYPPTAYGKPDDIRATSQSRRRWLDFVGWYYDRMTDLTAMVARVAHKHFPSSMLVVPLGNGDENLLWGQDNTAIPRALKPYGVHIRSTHGGFQPFAANTASMLKRIATAAKFYGLPFWSEPPGGITPAGEVGRFAEALACGSWGYWDWGSNPVGAADVFRQYQAFLTREKPVVDVALFFPTTDHRLHPEVGYPQRLRAIGAELRDVLDYDIVDETLVRDGALKSYRVLIWPEGTWVDGEALARIREWVAGGGVLVKVADDGIRTVDGNDTAGRELMGLLPSSQLVPVAGPVAIAKPGFVRHLADYSERRASLAADGLRPGVVALATAGEHPAAWAAPNGKGWVIAWGGIGATAEARRTFCELVRDAVYRLSALDPSKRDAAEVDTAWDGVYTTLLPTGEAILYNSNTAPREVKVGSRRVSMPASSLKSVMTPYGVRRLAAAFAQGGLPPAGSRPVKVARHHRR